MNTIEVNDSKLSLKDEICKLDYKKSEVELEINGNVSIYDINSDDIELNIKVNKDSNLIYYMYSDNEFKNKVITIDNYKNSSVRFNYSFINDKDSKLAINNNLLEDNINSDIKVRGVAKKDSNITITSNGYVKKDTKDSIFNEDLRGLNLDEGIVKIYPDMFIDTNEVIANHNSTIGNISSDYMFYLNTKGIDNRNAKKLIVNGFINSILDEEIKKDI